MLSYPFTSEVTYDDEGLPKYDRAVDSEFLRKVFLQYFCDGVFYKPTNALQVVVDTGMQVGVEPGACHIRGAMGIEESRRTLVVQASEEQDRIDTVVARLDLSRAVRSIDLYVLKGTAAVSPQAPELTRDSTIWEIGLANIFVAKNTATISQQRITDTRLDPSRCGIVAQTIGDLDTSAYFAQLAAAIAAHQAEAEAQIEALRKAIAEVEGDTAWMLKALYDSKNRNKDVFDTIIASAPMYTATYTTNGWVEADEDAKAKGYSYMQTVEPVPDDPDAPEIADSSVFLQPPSFTKTGVVATDETLSEALSVISAGDTVSGAGNVTTYTQDKPTVEIPVRWMIRPGVS